MIRINYLIRACLTAAALAAASSAHASTIITDWNFGALPVTAPDNNPAPTTGSGSAQALGMTNTYVESTGNNVSTNYDDILVDTNSTIGNQDTWRIRGAGATKGNGWSINAPQYTQGAEFDVSTSGYSGTTLSFNWASTTAGIANMQVQYTTNGTTWTNVGALLNATVGNSSVGGSFQTDTIDFGALGITSVDNNANFGVRLVSAYNPTLGTYASASSVIAGTPGAYNNNSGNWRFADVQIAGTAISAVPLPASSLLMLSGVAGLGLFARRRKGNCAVR